MTLVVALGWATTGCGVVVRGVTRGVNTFRNSEVFHQGRHGALTDDELAFAKVAWGYFTNNYNPETGLANAIDGVPTATMWTVADGLAALLVAYEFEFVDKQAFDARMSRLLQFLNTMSLFDGKVPNKHYQTKTGRKVDFNGQEEEVGWSAIDIGRLLTWLAIAADRHPIYREYIHKAVARWSFCDLVDDCGALFSGTRVLEEVELTQEGRLGYEEYAAKGFQIWGFETGLASSLEPYEVLTIYGIEMPFDARDPRETGVFAPIVSLPHLLSGLEFNWDKVGDLVSNDSEHTDPELADLAERVMAVQEQRFLREGIYTARTDHPVRGAPFFVYDTVLAGGYPWNTISDSGELYSSKALVSTRAVFPMWALYRNSYTQELLDVVCPLNDAKKGFFEGRYEGTGGRDTTLSATTNAMVLEALLYKRDGKLFRGDRESGYLDYVLENEFGRPNKCFPQERAACGA